jgi:DNA-binding NarL/FixJ family response regulator
MLGDNIRLGIVEDNEKLRNNYFEFFSLFANYNLTFVLESLNELKLQKKDLNLLIPHVILLDINLPGISGIDGIKILKNLYPDVIIIMLTAYDNEERIINAIENGASGYLLKGISLYQIKLYIDNYKTIGTAITPTIAGKLFEHIQTTKKKKSAVLQILTAREKEIVDGITDGLSDKEIGLRFQIKLNTVNAHLKKIYIKFNVKSRLELISRVLK